MTSDKQILIINWNVSKKTAIVLLTCAASSIAIPIYLQAQYSSSVLTFVLLHLAIVLVASAFFYDGLSRIDKFKTALTIFSFASFYGLLSNIFSQSVTLFSHDMIIMNATTVAVMNLCAVISTLSLAQIKKQTVTRVEKKDSAKPPSRTERLAVNTKPIYLALFVLAISLVLAIQSPQYFSDVSFAVTVPFFFYMQMLMTLVLTYFCFSDKKLKEKYRIYFTVLSLALLIGAIANFDHSQIVPRVGNRVNVNSATFFMMNTGALLTVLIFYMWKSYLEKIKNRLSSQ